MAEQPKVALVTGSALNIGRATALALARDGYRVMVTARSSAADCERTAEMIAEAGGEAAVHLADISDAKQATRTCRGGSRALRPARRAGEQCIDPPADQILRPDRGGVA